MREATGDRQTSPAPSPELLEYFDHHTSTANGPLTTGNIGEITGSELKFDKDNAEEGIFLINSADSSEVKVQTVSMHTEGKLMFLTPAGLTAGEYFLAVRKAYTSSARMREGRLNETLTVS